MMPEQSRERKRAVSLSDALRALADDASALGPSPSVEAALREELRLRARRRRPVWVAWGAALATCAAALVLMLPRPTAVRPTSQSLTPWYYNQGLPPARQGGIVRVKVSKSMAGSFGVPVPVTNSPDLTADLFIGEDGMTRAIRFVK